MVSVRRFFFLLAAAVRKFPVKIPSFPNVDAANAAATAPALAPNGDDDDDDPRPAALSSKLSRLPKSSQSAGTELMGDKFSSWPPSSKYGKYYKVKKI